MSGDILRRVALGMLVIALLLPTASAFAAPAMRSGGGTIAPQTSLDWSRAIFRSVCGLLSFVERTAEALTQVEPDPYNDPKNSEGNGIDPHGGPKP